MKLIFTPVIKPNTYEYRVEGETLTVMVGEQEETFDFSKTDESGRQVIATELKVSPVTSVVRDEDEQIVVHLQKWLQMPRKTEIPQPSNPAMDLPLEPRPVNQVARPQPMGEEPSDALIDAWDTYVNSQRAHAIALTEWREAKKVYEVEYKRLDDEYNQVTLPDWKKQEAAAVAQYEKDMAAFQEARKPETIVV